MSVIKKVEEDDEKTIEIGEEILEALGFEKSNTGVNSFEYQNRVKTRKIYLFGEVCTESVLDVVSKIHVLEYINPELDIELIINSGGGTLIDCLVLIDVMNSSPCDFKTVTLGEAASAACLISSNGTKGKRYGGQNAEFMFHETCTDIEDLKPSEIPYYKKETERNQGRCNRIFCKNTGKTIKEIRDVFFKEKDQFLTAVEARKFGIIDKVISNKKARREKKNE